MEDRLLAAAGAYCDRMGMTVEALDNPFIHAWSADGKRVLVWVTEVSFGREPEVPEGVVEQARRTGARLDLVQFARLTGDRALLRHYRGYEGPVA